jgi:SAM-dependent methyltransferase
MGDYPAIDDLQVDFDRLAEFDRCGWTHSSVYHHFLLENLPAHCQTALEIGCGTGAFARLLAPRSTKVVAFDLSPRMIALAHRRSAAYQNIEYIVADGIAYPLPLASSDCVVSIATLHHLDQTVALARMVDLLKPGGVLLVLDLYRSVTVTDYLMSSLALPVNLCLRLWHGDIKRKTVSVRKAWDAHHRNERIVTLQQARRACAEIIPGAQLRRHLLWRYSIVWTKPVS